MMQPLDPLTLRLQGQILIEASAGTGKTYTIELLFLRLLLERGLSVDQILIVTFTRAATEELRGRVRKRIRDALDVLENRNDGDEPLQKLIAGINDRDMAAIVLSDALTRMDEATIFTIHGFCQRMLQEHAFESGAPFEMEFLETEQLLRNRIIEDFWRHRFYTASDEEAAWAASLWKSPHDLLNCLGGHLTRPGVECVPVIDDDKLARQMAELLPLFAEVQSMWKDCGQEAADLLRENKRLSRNNSTTYGLTRLELAVDELKRFLSGTTMGLLMSYSLLELFTTSKINAPDSLKKTGKAAPPSHLFFDRFEDFFSAHQEMSICKRFAVLLAARNYLTSELSRRKEEQAQLYFDDLLTHLDAALSSDNGRQLAESISKRFPYILVDEFQDTDPLQYRIFSTIHTHAKNEATGLFLIGDPKQAIYGFRGADIFTYIQARRDTVPENRFTMTTNYRSTTPMVETVNLLFDRQEPFLFDESEIDFNRVGAAGLADKNPLLLNNTPLPALTCLMLAQNENGKPLAKGTAGEEAARFCAHEIGELLAAGMAGEAAIGDQQLTAGDIAVLVRTHNEAELVRKELHSLSISSVYYSQDSVFASEEAGRLLIVLTGLIDLADSSLVRSGLATDLFGYNAEQLDQLRTNEQQWEEIMNTLSRYRQIWQQEGFLPMFQTLMAEQKVVSRLHEASSGERILTNYLHLVELLQEAAQHQMGAEGLLRWFVDQIHAPEEQIDNRQLRLESDENLVKIVTIHKSKGLEYPIVFLPFLWAARTCKPKEPLPFHHPDQSDRLLIDLGTGNSDNYKLAEKERLAEDLRLLYVAITRARHSCFFCWNTINKMEESALCYLLHGGVVPGTKKLLADLESLNNEEFELAITQYPDSFVRPTLRTDEEKPSLSITGFKGHIDNNWQITSFSSLTAHHEQQPERPDYDQLADAEPQIAGHDVFAFPRGAAAGTCLHAILELIDFTDSSGHEQIIRTQIARAGFDDSWVDVVGSWMNAVLNTELANGFSLAELQDRDRVNEMSFYFPLQSLNLNRFNRVLGEFSVPFLPDQHETLQGLMVGFIDLVYRHDNRYYLADYKSNHLGNHTADYDRTNLTAAMLEHRYDLQYLIYTLALHRFLAGRIRGYDYETHFGGVSYLFLRGMNPKNEPETGVYSTRPPLLLINQLDKCCSGREDS